MHKLVAGALSTLAVAAVVAPSAGARPVSRHNGVTSSRLSMAAKITRFRRDGERRRRAGNTDRQAELRDRRVS